MLNSGGLRLLEPGDLIEGKYRIIRQIGEGGMGAVFEGEALRIHRRIAVKVLFPHAGSGDELAKRFQLEAQAAGRIGSSHIVEVIDLGVLPSGSHFMVMELLDGESLRQRIQGRGRLRPEEIYPIALQLLEGLAAAHNAGILHRDLKPDNVFLVRKPDGDFVKLLDFGISKFGAGRGPGTSQEMSLTRTGTLLGTPYYMSPEQASGGKQVDHRADIYAVGVILYEALTGAVPFQADTFNELIFKIVLEQPRSALSVVPNADPYFVQLVERAMARDPNQRFQSAEELRAALVQWASGAPAQQGPQFATTEAHDVGPELRLSNNTPGIWARTGQRSEDDDFLAPRRSRAPLLWAGALSLLVVSGVGLALALRSPGDSAKDAQPSSQPAPTGSALTAPPAAPPAVPAPQPSPAPEPAPVPAEPPPLVQVRPPQTERSHVRTPSPVAKTPKPPAATTAAAQPAPAVATPAPPPPSSEDIGRTRGGRTIRTDL
jgi:serine/threonine-protein kinase